MIWLKKIIYGIRYLRIKLFCGENFSAQPGFVCGRGCFAHRKVKVSIGRNFFMGNYCHLAVPADIADNVMFASFVSLVGGDHKIDNIDGPIRSAGREQVRPIRIEDDVWIGHGAIILHGVTVHSGAVVAAGSVVTKDVAARSIVGGNPARLIRFRD